MLKVLTRGNEAPQDAEAAPDPVPGLAGARITDIRAYVIERPEHRPPLPLARGRARLRRRYARSASGNATPSSAWTQMRA